jgi:H+/Cl- antiporter ClcA
MRRSISLLLGAITGGLAGFLSPVVAWGHHAISPSGSSGEWPWLLLWLLGAGVFIIVFIATWAVFSFLERAQRSGPDESESSRR